MSCRQKYKSTLLRRGRSLKVLHNQQMKLFKGLTTVGSHLKNLSRFQFYGWTILNTNIQEEIELQFWKVKHRCKNFWTNDLRNIIQTCIFPLNDLLSRDSAIHLNAWADHARHTDSVIQVPWCIICIVYIWLTSSLNLHHVLFLIRGCSTPESDQQRFRRLQILTDLQQVVRSCLVS